MFLVFETLADAQQALSKINEELGLPNIVTKTTTWSDIDVINYLDDILYTIAEPPISLNWQSMPGYLFMISDSLYRNNREELE
jgi:hypothetical protein